MTAPPLREVLTDISDFLTDLHYIQTLNAGYVPHVLFFST